MSTETSQVEFATVNGQRFVPGVQGFSESIVEPFMNPDAVSPNAPRWLWNPFAYVNIAARPVSGHAVLNNGTFIPITNKTDRQSVSGIATSPGKAFDWQQGSDPQVNGVATPLTPQGQYRNVTRTAHAIATELEDAYSDKGVRILPSLTKFNDFEAVKALHATLIADGLEFNADPYQPEHPVPNLVALEKYLVNEATSKAAAFGSKDLEVSPSAVIADILVSIRTAIAECRNVTRDAKRVVGNKTIGYQHVFDAYATRCFIALNEQVPSDLGEMYGKTETNNTDELSRLRAENAALKATADQKEIDDLKAENAKLKGEETDTTVKCDGIAASGERCKMNATIDGRCGKHPRIAEETKEIE